MVFWFFWICFWFNGIFLVNIVVVFGGYEVIFFDGGVGCKIEDWIIVLKYFGIVVLNSF